MHFFLTIFIQAVFEQGPVALAPSDTAKAAPRNNYTEAAPRESKGNEEELVSGGSVALRWDIAAGLGVPLENSGIAALQHPQPRALPGNRQLWDGSEALAQGGWRGGLGTSWGCPGDPAREGHRVHLQWG